MATPTNSSNSNQSYSRYWDCCTMLLDTTITITVLTSSRRPRESALGLLCTMKLMIRLTEVSIIVIIAGKMKSKWAWWSPVNGLYSGMRECVPLLPAHRRVACFCRPMYSPINQQFISTTILNLTTSHKWIMAIVSQTKETVQCMHFTVYLVSGASTEITCLYSVHTYCTLNT